MMNHSCAPNCKSRTVTVAGAKHVVLVARRAIAQGEELTYDYKLSEGDGERIKCSCGAIGCKGWMA